MTGRQLFLSGWEWHPSVIAGCALLQAGYLIVARFRLDRSTGFFAAGVAAMFVALVSPLDPLADDYLFSAHMLQHMLLDFVAPPLFVLGLPAETLQRALRWPPLDQAQRMLGRPAVAWTLGTVTLWVWHLPYLYNATLTNDGIHIFEHLTFLVTGTIMWWPVFAPLAECRMKPLASVVYLFLAAMANGLLGIIFTFLSVPVYEGYTHPDDELGALSLIRDTWGLDPLADQQLGGAFMWGGGGIIFGWATLAAFARWYREGEREAATAPWE